MNIFKMLCGRLACLVGALVLQTGNAGVIINELMASNTTLKDQDGETSDWIEIYNNSAEGVDLAGWSLTDSETEPQKWIFPATNLPPYGYLVVFASEKNRAVAGSELHTNFKLSADGEYLALYQPGGGTIAHDYTSYPRQRANASYGILTETVVTPLVQNGSTARVLVPTNNSLALSWVARSFNDTIWSSLNTPVGFDAGNVATPLLAIDFNERAVSASSTTQPGFSSFVINSNGSASDIQVPATTRTFGAISVTISNSTSLGYDDRLRGTPVNGGAFSESLLLRDFIFSRENASSEGLDVSITGLTPNQEHRFTIWSFDSGSPNNRVSDWFANGHLVKGNYVFNGSTLPTSNEQYQFSFDAVADASGKVLISGRRLPASATFGVFLNALNIETLASGTETNGLAQQMLNTNATAHIRIPFTVTNPNEFETLKLRIRYDDGFVAYINGQVVASRNAPATPQWNSAALGSRSASESLEFEEITIPNVAGLLTSADNVLAIHGLNANAADSDFLILPELDGVVSGVSTVRYFSVATPGSENISPDYLGLADEPVFSVSRGFFEAPFTVAMASPTVGAEIFWTTNGSTPAPDNGTKYTAPIHVSQTTLLRAAAYLPDHLPSHPVTHTYLFLDDVLQQPAALSGFPTTWQGNYPADYAVDPEIVGDPNYGPALKDDLRAIPTLSVVTDHDNFWDPATGIYVDATRRGEMYERAASLELFNGDNTTAFQINAGIQMQGNASRDNARTPKHSIRLKFKSMYGASKLTHDWFGSAVSEFDNIILRGCFTDSWATRYSDGNLVSGSEWRGQRYRPEDSLMLRDQWMKDSQRAMGHLSTHSDFVHVYLNGLYWGVYNPSERIDASFMAAHRGGREEDWDVLVGGDTSGIAEVADGNKTAWSEMMSLVNAGISDDTAYHALEQRVDIDNLIDYMILHFFAESEDWPHHNWYAAHRRANPTNGFPETKWIFLTWDQDIVMDRLVTRNRVNVSNNDTPARIYSELRKFSKFRQRFGDRVHQHYFNNGALTPSNNVARLAVRAARLDRAIVGESARWGDARKFAFGANPGTGVTFTRDEWWQPELEKLYTNWFQTMNAISLSRFQAAELYPETSAPSFDQPGGDVPFGFALTLQHTNASGTIFFTQDGTDPRNEATGAVAATAEAYDSPLSIVAVTRVRARVLSGGEWSALAEAVFSPPVDLSKLALTELMYDPPAFGGIDGNQLEFLELKNVGTNTLNLSGLTFSGISFTFPEGTTLAPGAFYVLARNSASFAARYPGVSVDGTYTGQLSNSGETIRLMTASGATIFSISFGVEAPWPVAASGAGFSMVPTQPGLSQAPDEGAKWRASSQLGGSPGADDPPLNISAIVINEILSHTDPPQRDSIELFNPTAQAVDISGWFLTDNVSNPRKFRIPNGTAILAGGYRYFDETHFNSSVGTNVNFAFSSTGEAVYLFSATTAGELTGYTHGFVFGPMFNGTNFGRYVNSVGEEFFSIEKSITLGSANSGPRVGPIVITEIHYHPETGGDEFIELFNAGSQSVPLFDPAADTNSWKVGGIAYTFPSSITLSAGEIILVTSTDPTSFRAKYNVPESVRIVGPYSGALNNNGEILTLEAPDRPNVDLVPYVVLEEIRYKDNAPWPAAADGGGASLQCIQATAFGSEPTNWVASIPTPGRLFDPNDADGDGIPDVFEMANGLNSQLNDAHDDLDEDGATNLEEYLNGTSPQVTQNFFRLGVSENGVPHQVVLDFYTLPGRNYRIEQTHVLAEPIWNQWFTLSNAPDASPVWVTNGISTTNSGFFRLNVSQ